MNKAKATLQTVKLLVPAGKAAPTPPVGPALGQKGIKAIDFCNQFNAVTANYIVGIPIPTRITVNPDRSYTFTTKAPPTSWLLKQALGIQKASARSQDVKVGTLSMKHIYHIAIMKSKDEAFAGMALESVCSRICAQAAGMGIQLVH